MAADGTLYEQAERAWRDDQPLLATALLQRFLRRQPGHGAAHHLLGRLLADQGEPALALQHQLRSCALYPQLGWNWFAAAELLQERGDWRQASTHYWRALQGLPGEPWIIERLALAESRFPGGIHPDRYRHWIAQQEPPLPPAHTPRHLLWLAPGDDRLADWPQLPAGLLERLPQAWLVLLAPDAQLRPGALALLEQELAAWSRRQADQPWPDLLYADEDRLDGQGRRCDPWGKPQWCPESFWSTPWLEGFSGWRLDWLRQQRLPLPGPGAPDRFAWQLAALACDPRKGHLRRILVHRRQPDLRADQLAQQADQLAQHLRASGEAVASVRPAGSEVRPAESQAEQAAFQLVWAVPSGVRCTAIIPSRDRADLLAPCLESLWQTAGGRAVSPWLELIVVDNGSRQAATAELLAQWQQRLGARLQVLRDDRPFNWSQLNNQAARRSGGELLLFLNNDTQALRSGWLAAMAGQALRPAVGCVGAVLLDAQGQLQHAGVVLGQGPAGAVHAYRGLPPEHRRHRGRSRLLSTWSAVTGACLMVRRELFLRVGGFDEALPVEHNDIDFCLRLGRLGLRQVVVPEAVLLHREAQSRDPQASSTAAAAQALMRRRWPAVLEGWDPCWPANF